MDNRIKTVEQVMTGAYRLVQLAVFGLLGFGFIMTYDRIDAATDATAVEPDRSKMSPTQQRIVDHMAAAQAEYGDDGFGTENDATYAGQDDWGR